jgi:hypothetical protein
VKKFGILTICLVLALVLGTVGCTPSEAQINRAIAKTQAASSPTPYPTYTPYPTFTPEPTVTPTPTEMPTSAFKNVITGLGFKYIDSQTSDADKYDVYGNSNGMIVLLFEDGSMVVALSLLSAYDADDQGTMLSKILIGTVGLPVAEWVDENFPSKLGDEKTGVVGHWTVSVYIMESDDGNPLLGVSLIP